MFANGNLAVGTTTDSGYKLDVNGTFRAGGAATFSSTIKSSDTNGFAIGSIASFRRIQYGSDAATAFSLLTDTNSYAGLYAGAATFSSSVTAQSLDIISASGVGSSTASGLARFITAGTSTAISVGQSNQTRRLDIGTYYINVTGEQFELSTASAQPLIFNTNATERMRITSGGNVLIGTTTNTSHKLTVYNATSAAQVRVAGAAPSVVFTDTVTDPATYIGYIGMATAANNFISGSAAGDYIFHNYSGGPILFGINNSEKMRITSGGNVLIGTTSAGTDFTRTACATSTQNVMGLVSTDDSSGAGFIAFRNSATTFIGGIARVGTTNAVAFNTTSDYRLKEDLQEIKGLEKVCAIKVYDFKWKDNEFRMDGVLAHELAEIIPFAVHGEKDAEEMQSVDYSKIVPVLVKAIQELKQEIDTLKNK
jgi:hypothetical protein